MADFSYSEQARGLQDRFATRNLADALVQVIVHDELSPEDTAFVGAADMFWLATVDARGAPTVSYKGGAPGFVHTPDSRTLRFPCYDGNGMYFSMGNVAATHAVALLFMDFERPHRLRVQGTATLSEDPALLLAFPGAHLVVTVAITALFQNCPRYIHRMQRSAPSRYVPAADGSAPLPGWKRIDAIQPVLAPQDQDRAAALGLITSDQYGALVKGGDPSA